MANHHQQQQQQQKQKQQVQQQVQWNFVWVTLALLAQAMVGNAFVVPSTFRRLPVANHLRVKDDVNVNVNVNVNVVSKYFQLEELEDHETTTSEIYLHDDQTVEVGETDGPLAVAAHGTWSMTLDPGSSEPEFSMTIHRTFETGRQQPSRQPSDGDSDDTGTGTGTIGTATDTSMGVFQFTVERNYRGMVTQVGGTITAVTGSMHLIDEQMGDIKLGYFNMIDTTQARQYEE